jgi:tetratricopeptide (TPR) repeat protein
MASVYRPHKYESTNQYQRYCRVFCCLSVCLFALCGCSSTTLADSWSAGTHLRNWEKLRLYGEQAQVDGQWAQAETFYRQAAHEANHAGIAQWMVAGTLNLLAEAQLHNGKVQEAARTFDKALDSYQIAKAMNSSQPLAHLEYANCLTGKARTTAALASPQAALPDYEKALLAYQTETYAPLSILKARAQAKCYVTLADTYLRLGNKQKALGALKDGTNLLKDGSNPKLLSDMLALSARVRHGEIVGEEPAAPIMSEADSQALQEKTANRNQTKQVLQAESSSLNTKLSDNNRTTNSATKIANWEDVYNQYKKQIGKGDEVKQEKLLLQAYGLSKSFGETDIRKRTIVTQLGYFYGIRAQWGQALPYYKEEVALNKATFGDDDLTAALPLNRLGRAYMRLGQLQLSEQTLRAARTLVQKAHGDKQLAYIRISGTLAELMCLKKKYAESLQILHEAEPVARKLGEHGTLAGFLKTRAFCQEKQGLAGEARKTLETAMTICEEHLPYDEQWSIAVQLATLCFQLKDYKAADANFERAEIALTNAAEGRTLRKVARVAAPAIFQAHENFLALSGDNKKAEAIRHQLTELESTPSISSNKPSAGKQRPQ